MQCEDQVTSTLDNHKGIKCCHCCLCHHSSLLLFANFEQSSQRADASNWSLQSERSGAVGRINKLELHSQTAAACERLYVSFVSFQKECEQGCDGRVGVLWCDFAKNSDDFNLEMSCYWALRHFTAIKDAYKCIGNKLTPLNSILKGRGLALSAVVVNFRAPSELLQMRSFDPWYQLIIVVVFTCFQSVD